MWGDELPWINRALAYRFECQTCQCETKVSFNDNGRNFNMSHVSFLCENFSRPPSATLIPCQVVGGVPSPKPGDRPALHTPLEKRRSHCKRGSSQQNLLEKMQQLQHRGKGYDGKKLFFDCKEKHRKLLDWIIKTVWKQVKTFYHSGFAMMIGKSKPILRWKKWMEKSKEVKRDAHTVEKRWQKTWEELRREGKLPRDHESCDKNRNDFLRAAAKSGEQMVGLEKRWGKMRTDSQNMLSMTWSSTSAPIGKPRLWIL